MLQGGDVGAERAAAEIVERRVAAATAAERCGPAGSSAAVTRCPSVWPIGPSRTAAETRFGDEGEREGFEARPRAEHPARAQAAPKATG